jgi:prefoldin subunit 5
MIEKLTTKKELDKTRSTMQKKIDELEVKVETLQKILRECQTDNEVYKARYDTLRWVISEYKPSQ